MDLKLLGQNLRTKISTIIAVGAYLNMLLATFDPSIIADNPTAVHWYKILSAILAFCAWANSHYYNQDYTPEMDAHTKLGRQQKALRTYETSYVEEPEDSYIEEEIVAEESEVQNGEK